MEQNKVTQVLLIVFVAILMCIAICYGLGFWGLKTSWQFKYEVELVDFINLLTTIGCTLGAAWFVSKKLSEDRFEKDLQINDLKKIEEQINGLIAIIVRNQSLSEENKEEILNINAYLNNLINRFVIVNSVNNNTNIRESFNLFYRYSTNFGDDFNVPSIISYGDNLLKAVREEIRLINKK